MGRRIHIHMARFESLDDKKVQLSKLNHISQVKNYPFKNVYAAIEGQYVYVNMEANESLSAKMVTLRDVAIILDISGTMHPYYQNGAVEKLCCQIVDSLSPYDDDGIDIFFFSNGLVYHENVSNGEQVRSAIRTALMQEKAYGTTMPTEAFKVFCQQLKEKKRDGTVMFLTDGQMDDAGRELKNFYIHYLHNEFKTRDHFYCYSIEFGNLSFGALNVLDGLFAPEQGPEDLFDLESADNLEKIASVLAQVGGMSAVGSNDIVHASVTGKPYIDMVNSDLIEGGTQEVKGPINKVMSFRVISGEPFNLQLKMDGFATMNIKVTPRGVTGEIEIS